MSSAPSIVFSFDDTDETDADAAEAAPTLPAGELTDARIDSFTQNTGPNATDSELLVADAKNDET